MYICFCFFFHATILHFESKVGVSVFKLLILVSLGSWLECFGCRAFLVVLWSLCLLTVLVAIARNFGGQLALLGHVGMV